MNPLPRLLGLALLFVLAALAFLLAVPALSDVTARTFSPSTAGRAATTAAANPTPSETARVSPTPARLAAFAHRAAIPLALTALVLAAALIASLSVRPARSSDSRPPFQNPRADLTALARLAASSAEQSQALARERDDRRRAEADSLLNQQLLNRSLEEKIRLGRDLHDGIIQSLYAAGLTIESARAVAKTDPAEADRRLTNCLQSLNQSIRDVRAYIVGLAPENLLQAGFTDALHHLAEELRGGRDATFDIKIDESATAHLAPAQSIETLQIAREAISNGLRHGHATRFTVRLHPGDRELCLLVQDNGTGFTPAHHAGSGHGLANMDARARRIGGQLRVESQPAAGTRVIFTLPLHSI